MVTDIFGPAQWAVARTFAHAVDCQGGEYRVTFLRFLMMTAVLCPCSLCNVSSMGFVESMWPHLVQWVAEGRALRAVHALRMRVDFKLFMQRHPNEPPRPATARLSALQERARQEVVDHCPSATKSMVLTYLRAALVVYDALEEDVEADVHEVLTEYMDTLVELLRATRDTFKLPPTHDLVVLYNVLRVAPAGESLGTKDGYTRCLGAIELALGHTDIVVTPDARAYTGMLATSIAAASDGSDSDVPFNSDLQSDSLLLNKDTHSSAASVYLRSMASDSDPIKP